MTINDLKVGTLLRVKEHCRNNISILQNGEYAILAPSQAKYFSHDVVFPSGERTIFVAKNWEVVSRAR